MRASLFRRFFFFFFVLAVSAYAFYEYTDTEKKAVTDREKSSLLLDSLEEVQEISIKNQTETFTLSHESGNWILKKPFKDFIDFDELSTWFARLQREQLSKIKVEQPIDWKSYYLDDPFALEWTLKSGEKKSLFISSRSNFNGKYFVKKAEVLFLGSSLLGRGGIDKSKEDFRSKKVIHSFGHPHQMIVKGKGTLVFDWKDYRWSFKNNTKFPLDEGRLNGFWTYLTSLKAERIVAFANSAQLKKYGLDKTPFKIILKFAKGKKSIIRISILKSNKVFILNSDRKYILQISKKDFKQLSLNRGAIRKKLDLKKGDQHNIEK